MTTPLQIPIKYCKSLETPNTSWSLQNQAGALRFFQKLLYEWWGFCVNGGTSLTVPGGFAAINMPSGFQSGTLLMQGTDGSTSFGFDSFFSPSSNFILTSGSSGIVSGSLVGKYLVTWVPGSPGLAATDDGVYLIKSVDDPQHLRLEMHSGGTRRLGNHPWFWDRNNINWRIVDIVQATHLAGWADGNYQVLTFGGAPTVNPGQAQSQLQVFHRIPGGN